MKRKFSVTIDEEIVAKIDDLVSNDGKFSSRSHAFQYYAKQGLRKNGHKA